MGFAVHSFHFFSATRLRMLLLLLLLLLLLVVVVLLLLPPGRGSRSTAASACSAKAVRLLRGGCRLELLRLDGLQVLMGIVVAIAVVEQTCLLLLQYCVVLLLRVLLLLLLLMLLEVPAWTRRRSRHWTEVVRPGLERTLLCIYPSVSFSAGPDWQLLTLLRLNS